MRGIMAYMVDYRALEEKLRDMVGGVRRPVAIVFLDTVPEGMTKFSGMVPSSCSFWSLAAAGQSFYTVAADQANCPVGAYTSGVLMPQRMGDLEQTLSLMAGIGYIRMEEVPGVFHMQKTPAAIAYTPLGETPAAPSAVLVTGKPAGVMMLAEAAVRAGAMAGLPLLGRPTCMAIPAALAQGTVISSGCIGNRVYTDIGEDELYVVMRGTDLEQIGSEIETIVSANQKLTEYHRDRRRALSAL
jgi:uncharacterized protein (DUF169 family)